MAKKRLIDLYPYKIVKDRPEFLLLKRAKGKIYQGQWRMIGGKVEPGETSWQAALRELSEETGLVPDKFWTIPSVNTFYEHKRDMVHHIPAFAAEIHSAKTPELDDEHTEFDWLALDEALSRINWPEQRRLMKLTNSIITENEILDDWIVSTS